MLQTVGNGRVRSGLGGLHGRGRGRGQVVADGNARRLVVNLHSDLCAAAEECQFDITRYGSSFTPCTVLPTRHGGPKVTLFGPSADVVLNYAQVTPGYLLCITCASKALVHMVNAKIAFAYFSKPLHANGRCQDCICICVKISAFKWSLPRLYLHICQNLCRIMTNLQ